MPQANGPLYSAYESKGIITIHFNSQVYLPRQYTTRIQLNNDTLMYAVYFLTTNYLFAFAVYVLFIIQNQSKTFVLSGGCTIQVVELWSTAVYLVAFDEG